jgi:hypothetical protein
LSSANASEVNRPEVDEAAEHLAQQSNEQLAELHLGRGEPGDAGEMLAEAKAAYKRRLSELREELEEAKERGNEERVARAEDEIEALSRAVGLGGRDRRAGSPEERARLSVSRAIKAAIKRIEEKRPEVTRYLTSTISYRDVLLLSS